jgi:hypothetical protein
MIELYVQKGIITLQTFGGTIYRHIEWSKKPIADPISKIIPL